MQAKNRKEKNPNNFLLFLSYLHANTIDFFVYVEKKK